MSKDLRAMLKSSAMAGIMAGSLAACGGGTEVPKPSHDGANHDHAHEASKGDAHGDHAHEANKADAHGDHAKPDEEHAKPEGEQHTKIPAHACAGQNECKGQGGCKSGDNGCYGKNSCKGKGGCKTG